MDGQKLKILIVDDYKPCRDASILMIEEIFAKPVELITADDGLEAYEKIEAAGKESVPFGILVTDYNMPEMDGCELSGLVREMHPSIKIVMISAEIPTQRPDYIDYLVRKPSTFETLERVFNKIIN